MLVTKKNNKKQMGKKLPPRSCGGSSQTSSSIFFISPFSYHLSAANIEKLKLYTQSSSDLRRLIAYVPRQKGHYCCRMLNSVITALGLLLTVALA